MYFVTCKGNKVVYVYCVCQDSHTLKHKHAHQLDQAAAFSTADQAAARSIPRATEALHTEPLSASLVTPVTGAS